MNFFGKGVVFWVFVFFWGRVYKYLIKTSPRWPAKAPSTYSSVFASCHVKNKTKQKTLKVMTVFHFHIRRRGRKHIVNNNPCTKTRKTYTATANMRYRVLIQSQTHSVIHKHILQLCRRNLFYWMHNARNIFQRTKNKMNLNTTTCCLSHLHVHVAIHRHQVALVLHSPLQLHHYWFACQAVEEGLRVQR